jgi:hypothetical protein
LNPIVAIPFNTSNKPESELEVAFMSVAILSVPTTAVSAFNELVRNLLYRFKNVRLTGNFQGRDAYIILLFYVKAKAVTSGEELFNAADNTTGYIIAPPASPYAVIPFPGIHLTLTE